MPAAAAGALLSAGQGSYAGSQVTSRPAPDLLQQAQRCSSPPALPDDLRTLRFLSAVRRHLDVVVVPGNHDPTQEFVQWVVDTLQLDPRQFVFTSGRSAMMDHDIGMRRTRP